MLFKYLLDFTTYCYKFSFFAICAATIYYMLATTSMVTSY